MLKTGLNIAHFKEHVKLIETETIEYFKRWGDSGERSKLLYFLKCIIKMSIKYKSAVRVPMESGKNVNFLALILTTCHKR